MTEEQVKQAQEAFARQQEQQRKDQIALAEAQRLAAERQMLIDRAPRQQYACIVAVDLHGGFSKDGQIPWHYKEDFAWFKSKTDGHICVMGRATYDGINEKIGEKGEESVLPNRKCFVVTSTPLPRSNATVVADIYEVEKLLAVEDLEKTIFYIGGESIYNKGINKSDMAYVTVVNKSDIKCDRKFPTSALMKCFDISNVHSHPDAPEIMFLTYKRKTK